MGSGLQHRLDCSTTRGSGRGHLRQCRRGLDRVLVPPRSPHAPTLVAPAELFVCILPSVCVGPLHRCARLCREQHARCRVLMCRVVQDATTQGVGVGGQMMMVCLQCTGIAAYKCRSQGGGAVMQQPVMQQQGDPMQTVGRLCCAVLQMVC